MNPIDKLPKELTPIKDQFKKFLKNSIGISLQFKTTKPYESNLYGKPYIPEGGELPIDISGEPMKYFAQINFEEFDKTPGFPSKGLLVIFLGKHIDYSTEINSKAYYYEELNLKSNILNPEAVIVKYEESRKMTFSPLKELPGPNTIEFKQHLEPLFNKKTLNVKYIQQMDKIWQGYEKNCEQEFDSKIGGYPEFFQTDPSDYDNFEEYQLLLKIGLGDISSGKPTGLYAGDMQIFIKNIDLENKNFGNLRTYFECE